MTNFPRIASLFALILTVVLSAAAPAMRQTPWYELPHSQRIVRWLFSHPPRVQTLSAVSAALSGLFGAGC